jgi:hypothetical protein
MCTKEQQQHTTGVDTFAVFVVGMAFSPLSFFLLVTSSFSAVRLPGRMGAVYNYK